MAKPRRRWDELGRALPCKVELPPKVAAYVYREVLQELHGDETELVTRIVTDWIKARNLPPVDWDALVRATLDKQKAEREAEEAALKAAKKNRGRTG